jgi:hypothetical protein
MPQERLLTAEVPMQHVEAGVKVHAFICKKRNSSVCFLCLAIMSGAFPSGPGKRVVLKSPETYFNFLFLPFHFAHPHDHYR